MSDLDRLLDLQANDTHADQLHHRRATLPERARLVELEQREAELTSDAVEPQALRDDLAREQRRLEDEIATVEEKAAAVDRQLYGGGMTSPKEAQALQADVESLKRRQGTLEDQVLEIMEQLEPLEDSLAAGAGLLAEVQTQRAEVLSALVEAEAQLDAEISQVEGARSGLVDGIPAELVAEYERIRKQHGGVAVARLSGSTCQGCHLTLAPAEVDGLRRQPDDAVLHCPDCGRLLAR